MCVCVEARVPTTHTHTDIKIYNHSQYNPSIHHIQDTWRHLSISFLPAAPRRHWRRITYSWTDFNEWETLYGLLRRATNISFCSNLSHDKRWKRRILIVIQLHGQYWFSGNITHSDTHYLIISTVVLREWSNNWEYLKNDTQEVSKQKPVGIHQGWWCLKSYIRIIILYGYWFGP